jgi:serine protease
MMIMKRNTASRTAALAAGVLLAIGSAAAFAGEFRAVENPVQGRYIVVLKQSAARLSTEVGIKSRVPDVARGMAAGHGAKLLRSYENVLRGFVVDADDRALAKLLADPRVAYVEEDGYARINATQSGATWGLDRVDQRNLPLSSTYTYNTTAAGVHAYIIDTGMLATHNEYAGRVGNGFDAVGGGTNDCHGHGTHVAGTVGGTTYGVAKGVTLHPVRVLDCGGSGTWAGVIAGIDWVAANRVLPAVANMSLGGGANASVDTAVANLTNAGVTVAVAAGNNSSDACSFSPARAPSAITVGSTTSTDAASSFTNWGTCLDIFAPGSSITSSWNTGNSATNTISGTSMASPHVAGAAALYLASNPSASPATVRNALVANATPSKVTGIPGSGSPNLLLYTLGSAPPPPPPGCGILASGASLATGQSVTSCDGRFTLVIQGDGNLVLYQAGVGALWANHVYGNGHTLHMQGDGNLVVYNNIGQARWHTYTYGRNGAYLAVQNDGNVVVYSTTSQALWWSGTCCR